MKSHRSILAFFLALISIGLSAQEEEKSIGIGMSRFLFGYGQFPNEELGTFAPQLEDPDGHHFVFSVSNGWLDENFAFFINVMAAGINTVENDSLEMYNGSISFSLDFGYPIINQKNTKLYPLIGLGGTFYNSTLTPKGDLDLNQIQENYGRELSLSKAGFAIDFSLNLDLLPKWDYNENAENYNAWLIGLKLGYHYEFANDNWEYSGGNINGAPRFGMQGFYLGLVLGLAGTDQI